MFVRGGTFPFYIAVLDLCLIAFKDVALLLNRRARSLHNWSSLYLCTRTF